MPPAPCRPGGTIELQMRASPSRSSAAVRAERPAPAPSAVPEPVVGDEAVACRGENGNLELPRQAASRAGVQETTGTRCRRYPDTRCACQRKPRAPRALLPRGWNPGFAQIFQHAGVDELGARRGLESVRHRRLARLRQARRERRFGRWIAAPAGKRFAQASRAGRARSSTSRRNAAGRPAPDSCAPAGSPPAGRAAARDASTRRRSAR